ncbi:hypothetical protein RUM43_005992 [Polyplax serrata]|uniref:Uncharacterized protein n=1 Tax=Polyplax serrata TaxID=468196 RepID=A0AAN8P0R6_POLSC
MRCFRDGNQTIAPSPSFPETISVVILRGFRIWSQTSTDRSQEECVYFVDVKQLSHHSLLLLQTMRTNLCVGHTLPSQPTAEIEPWTGVALAVRKMTQTCLKQITCSPVLPVGSSGIYQDFYWVLTVPLSPEGLSTSLRPLPPITGRTVSVRSSTTKVIITINHEYFVFKEPADRSMTGVAGISLGGSSNLTSRHLSESDLT